ncbi:Crp/Fnr family transcriptional regulator [Metabacillus malikii]|uniref:CRP-like cAMP-binding protein n=1 Tax=Metabacillus malikii TaxID=1504265 RepID=A0ABT9ZMG9_9BACI|nr:Crp/Fnr family transcriptional regulator [Metabacillus malikii]MDQ0233104.1 CRP-like cAMP-binding protein [Metabacillus malikii]
MNELIVLKRYLDKYTEYSEEEKQAVLRALNIQEIKKGDYLIRQGDIPVEQCYFVLKGCVRQYDIDVEGKEVTVNFYTEEQAILLFHMDNPYEKSKYSFTCLEDSVMVVGNLETELEMFEQYSELESMTRQLTEMNLHETHHEFAKFIRASPEERYKTIIQSRPDLLKRVPQHQLASYLGITPESLSRIKKRIR